MLVAERFCCSMEADAVWRRLRALWALKRAKGDAQLEGVDWAERAEAMGHQHSDLGTEARLLYVASERALELLAVMGHSAEIGAALARRRLSGHGTNQEERRYGLERETRDELLEGAKEWLGWSLNDEALELPELPF